MKLRSSILSSCLLGTVTAAFFSVIPHVLAQAASSRAAAIFDSMPATNRIDEAVISPDGSSVAYIVSGALTVAPAAGGPGKNIAVQGNLPLRAVSWSPDSKQIAFLADIEGEAPAAQVWTAAVASGTPTKHAQLKGYVDAPRFSPDRLTLALLFIEGMPRSAGPLQPMTPLSGEIGNQIFEQRLATIDLTKGDLSKNDPGTDALLLITPADVYIYEYDWMPDCHGWIATAAHGSGDANWYVAHLYHIDATSRQMHEIYVPKLQIAEPHVSPDGKQVAFIEGLMSDEGVTGGDVFVISFGAGGGPRNVTPGIKSSPSALFWADQEKIIFTQNVDGLSGFASVKSAGGAVQTIWTGQEFIGNSASPSATFSRDGKVTAMVRQSPSTPAEVWAGPIGHWTQVTAINANAKPAWGESHNFHWTSDNLQLDGWLTLPKDFDPNQTYPLLVSVHGGPSGACTARWDTRLAGPASAMNYFVLCPNPRGSYGQGEAFTQGNVKDLGGGDFRDIMAGVDAIAKQYPIDPKRIGIRGHSYGGYMTMWAETQTNRFSAAVAGAGLSDWLSYYGVNDIDEWMLPFFGASIYDDPAVYAKSDPIHFVKAVKTPTLILVGDSDGEVPMEQSVEWWHALDALKVPTKLVVYPHEGHMFLKPADSRDYAVRTLEWFEEWFAKAPATQ
jgi:dipeptidyl aminopeptidase/acylaminoacyl peptidase